MVDKRGGDVEVEGWLHRYLPPVAPPEMHPQYPFDTHRTPQPFRFLIELEVQVLLVDKTRSCLVCNVSIPRSF